MNKQANIFFIPSSISGNDAEPRDAVSNHGYFQQLISASLARSIYTIEGFRSLARQLAIIARHADWAKQIDACEQATQVMLALPISDQLDDTVRHYQALCMKQRGDFEGARRLLEIVAEEAGPHYRARALQVIGATHFERGEVDLSLPFYLAAGNAAVGCDPLTLVASQKMTAVVRGIHGDHKRALADLERLFPLVCALGKYYPAAYYDFLNSLAVELCEAGRVTEAQAALSISLASPFASAYPEWTETRDEIAAKRASATPSFVAINRAPEARLAPQTAQQRQRKRPAPPVFWLSALKQARFQITIICPQAPAAVTTGLSRGILDWMRKRVGPRAPPHSR